MITLKETKMKKSNKKEVSSEVQGVHEPDKYPFAKAFLVELCDSRLSAQAKVLLFYLKIRAGGKEYSWMSNAEVAKHFNTSVRSVGTWMSELEEVGLLSVKNRGPFKTRLKILSGVEKVYGNEKLDNTYGILSSKTSQQEWNDYTCRVEGKFDSSHDESVQNSSCEDTKDSSCHDAKETSPISRSREQVDKKEPEILSLLRKDVDIQKDDLREIIRSEIRDLLKEELKDLLEGKITSGSQKEIQTSPPNPLPPSPSPVKDGGFSDLNQDRDLEIARALAAGKELNEAQKKDNQMRRQAKQAAEPEKVKIPWKERYTSNEVGEEQHNSQDVWNWLNQGIRDHIGDYPMDKWLPKSKEQAMAKKLIAQRGSAKVKKVIQYICQNWTDKGFCKRYGIKPDLDMPTISWIVGIGGDRIFLEIQKSGVEVKNKNSKDKILDESDFKW